MNLLISLYLFAPLLVLSIIVVDLSGAVGVQPVNVLKHVYAIFAHKLYAPLEPKYGIPEELSFQHFIKDTYKMPIEAQREMFDLGLYLRKRYDEFLGETYYTEVMRTRTSAYHLSMISGLLVNAGLWPPSKAQNWNNELNWQPTLTEYDPVESDVLFLGTLCPHFLDEENRILTHESIKNEVSAHRPLFNHITTEYGKKIERPSDISMLYSSLETIASNPNGTLPGWADGIFPHGEMQNVTLLSYELLSKTKVQRRLNGGVFLRSIINETTRLIGINDTFDSHMNMSRDAKISLYSGEERNLIGTLQAMNIWDSSHLPQNGASLIFELRYNRTANVYGFEIYYYTGSSDNMTIGLALPGCEVFCPLTDFARIVDDALPNDEKSLCKSNQMNNSADDNRRHYLLRSVTLSLAFLFALVSR